MAATTGSLSTNSEVLSDNQGSFTFDAIKAFEFGDLNGCPLPFVFICKVHHCSHHPTAGVANPSKGTATSRTSPDLPLTAPSKASLMELNARRYGLPRQVGQLIIATASALQLLCGKIMKKLSLPKRANKQNLQIINHTWPVAEPADYPTSHGASAYQAPHTEAG